MCLRENCPSKSSITRAVREDLGYSYKRLNVTARESLTENAEQRLLEYLTACSTIDPTSMHFFDECSVIKTTGNRRYGHSQIGVPAVEIQRYASNVSESSCFWKVDNQLFKSSPSPSAYAIAFAIYIRNLEVKFAISIRTSQSKLEFSFQSSQFDWLQ